MRVSILNIMYLRFNHKITDNIFLRFSRIENNRKNNFTEVDINCKNFKSHFHQQVADER